MGTGGLFPGSKAAERKADNPPPSSIAVNAWSYTSTPHTSLQCLFN